MKKKKIGLALGGGGARGLAHIGVLKVLEEAGIEIDMIVGTSMGAFVGSYYALGLDLAELEKEAISFTKTKAISTFVDLATHRKSILKGIKAEKYIRKMVGEKTLLEDTRIPTRIVCTDLSNGEEIILKKGDISEAIRASISVPAIFPPVKIDGRYLVDGGVINSTPVDVVKNMGADVVIGVDLVMKREAKLDNPNMVTSLLQSYEIIRTQWIKHNISRVDKDAVIIEPEMRGTIDSFKFYDINKFIVSGEEATCKALPKIMEMINR